MQYRHGDLMLEKLEALPKSIQKKLPHTILAHGEITGHTHRIAEVHVANVYQTPTDLVLEVHGEFASLVHDEHDTIQVPRGIYRVWRQREYSPEEIRIIRD